jgi:hypothetical protein
MDVVGMTFGIIAFALAVAALGRLQAVEKRLAKLEAGAPTES